MQGLWRDIVETQKHLLKEMHRQVSLPVIFRMVLMSLLMTVLMMRVMMTGRQMNIMTNPTMTDTMMILTAMAKNTKPGKDSLPN